jgi:uncharacterized membrane protein YidH (DUF202 family)
MLNYLFALASIIIGITCLFLSKSTKYYKNIENKYGEAAADKVTKSLKIWGYFLLVAAVILLIALLFEVGAVK